MEKQGALACISLKKKHKITDFLSLIYQYQQRDYEYIEFKNNSVSGEIEANLTIPVKIEINKFDLISVIAKCEDEDTPFIEIVRYLRNMLVDSVVIKKD